nr:MAG TPA: hypothetical protein [Caudoviricetes sp.]
MTQRYHNNDIPIEAMIAAQVYKECGSIRSVADGLKCSTYKAKKLLVTAGALNTPEAALARAGVSVERIAEMQRVTESAVHRNVPYVKGVYNAKFPTTNALRIRMCRARQRENE